LWAFGNEEKGIKPYVNYKHCVSYTKQVLRYALVKGYIQKNPYDLLEMPVNADLKNKKEEKSHQKYYSKELIQQVLTLMKQEYGVRDYTLLSLIYQLGAANGEIYPLVWTDIDFKNKTISLMHKLVKNKAIGKYAHVQGMKNSYRF
jgi:integrase